MWRKAQLGEDVRRFRFEDNGTYKELVQKLSELYLLKPSDFTLRYKDEEQELISICTDADLKEALQMGMTRVYILTPEKSTISTGTSVECDLPLQFTRQPEFQENVLSMTKALISSEAFRDMLAQVFTSTVSSLQSNPVPAFSSSPIPSDISTQISTSNSLQNSHTSPQTYPLPGSPISEVAATGNPNIPIDVPSTYNKPLIPIVDDDTPSEQDWKPVLEQLHDMGFSDDRINMELLLQHKGSVMKTVEELLGAMKKT